jgi:hypothetical protein
VKIDVWDEDSVSQADQIGLTTFPVKKLLLKEPIVLSDYKVLLSGDHPIHAAAAAAAAASVCGHR